MSVSKLQTIKSIAAERKLVERRGSSLKNDSGRSHRHPRSYPDANKYTSAIKAASQGK